MSKPPPPKRNLRIPPFLPSPCVSLVHQAERPSRVVNGPEEWMGTKISFDLKQEGDWTIVLFKHQGWKEPVEFMHHCSTKWGVFLLSLKSLLETGKGAPSPNEIKLDSWE